MHIYPLNSKTHDVNLGSLIIREANPKEKSEKYLLNTEDESAAKRMDTATWSCVDGDRFLATINSAGKRIDALVGVIEEKGVKEILQVECKLKVYSAKNLAGHMLLDEILDKRKDSIATLKQKPPSWFTQCTQYTIGLLASCALETARSDLNRWQIVDPKYKTLAWHSPPSLESFLRV
jgi:hypothetical protein